MGKIHDALVKAGKNRESENITVELPKNNDKSDRIVAIDRAKPLYFEERLDENLVAYFAPQSREAELFKILRTNILFPLTGKPPKSIMVTSAVPGEGKSFVSSNLSISIASGIEEHVLLIDCDMRNPSVHRVFGYNEAVGLSDHLSKGIELPSVLLKTIVKKLAILPAGTPPTNPAELLSSTQMSSLLKELKDRYDDRYLIIDTPPPHFTSETKALSQLVDGIILVVRSESTPRKVVNEVVDMLGKEKILGIVFNFFDTRLPKSYKSSKYAKSYVKN